MFFKGSYQLKTFCDFMEGLEYFHTQQNAHSPTYNMISLLDRVVSWF